MSLHTSHLSPLRIALLLVRVRNSVEYLVIVLTGSPEDGQ